MYYLDYIILEHAHTHLYKLSENIYFYQVIFNRFCFIMYFLSGEDKIQSSVNNNLRTKMYNRHFSANMPRYAATWQLRFLPGNKMIKNVDYFWLQCG